MFYSVVVLIAVYKDEDGWMKSSKSGLKDFTQNGNHLWDCDSWSQRQ